MARKKITKMAYGSGAEMMFGTAKHPVTTKRGIVIGGGHVHPEVVPHPRPGSEKTMKTLLREYEKANGDALERMVIVGHPTLQIENEHVFQMTHNPKWGGEIAAQTARQMDDYLEKYGLKASYRSTPADLRKPDMVNMRDSDYTREIIESFEECSKYADVVSIESMGGKEIFDHAIIRNDIGGILFGIGVLGAIDMEWMWNQIVAICKKNNCIAGGDTNCSEANTAMFMAGGMTSKDVPHVIAALSRAIAASRTLVAYECGATGPTKDCAYEDPIIKAMSGVPISTEGKTSACAHSDLAGNLIMAVCDLWSNEAVEYHDMFGATTTSVFAEILGYDVAMLNTSIDLGYQEQMKEILVTSDKYRDSHSLIVAPDNAWEVGNAITSNRATSNYASARAGAMKAGEIILGDAQMKLTALEQSSLEKAMKDMEALPDAEGDFIDQCLAKYKDVKGFNPGSYGL
ncbi:MAG: methanol--corrinoid methyltransferase [Desulfobacteraceae bacterium 4572_87]|nr:MAG: methanol--corrinoid methyltransferase [Desulfobacteraceae bacterium 4572_87]